MDLENIHKNNDPFKNRHRELVKLMGLTEMTDLSSQLSLVPRSLSGFSQCSYLMSSLN